MGNHSEVTMDGRNDSVSVGWSIVSPEQLHIFGIVNSVIICQAVILFGVVSNTINLIVFWKIGFKDSINVSLFSLAIADFLGCFCLIWWSICVNPWFQELDLPFDPNAIHIVYSGTLHMVFTRITGVLTCFITLERCLCVMMPLKVKTIITKTRMTIFIVFTYSILIAAFVPVAYSNRHEFVFYKSLNKSIVSLVFTPEWVDIERYHIPVYNIYLPCFIFIAVIICTTLLITTLNRKARWREGAQGGSKSSEGSSKEKKVATMVASIAVLFIVCFLPNVLIIAAMRFDPEFNILGVRRNLFVLSLRCTYMCETINASMNIFFYYYKNTNYRKAFRQVILRKSVK